MRARRPTCWTRARHRQCRLPRLSRRRPPSAQVLALGAGARPRRQGGRREFSPPRPPTCPSPCSRCRVGHLLVGSEGDTPRRRSGSSPSTFRASTGSARLRELADPGHEGTGDRPPTPPTSCSAPPTNVDPSARLHHDAGGPSCSTAWGKSIDGPASRHCPVRRADHRHRFVPVG